MRRIRDWIRARAKARPGRFLLWMLGINVLFVGLFDVFGRTLPPGGPDVIDLQLSLSSGVFTQIVRAWGGAVDGVFWSILVLDFLFPVAYAVLLRHVYRLACASALLQPKRGILRAPVAAAICDAIENGLLLILLSLPLPPPGALVGLMSAAAILKFLLLTVTAGFIVAALADSDAVRVIKTTRYAVLSLLIGTLPLFALDQGRDLMVSLSNDGAGWHRFWFVIWLIVWGFSSWYWSRVLLDADAARQSTPQFDAWSAWLPRWAGALTMMVPGAAILLEADQAVRSGTMWWLGALCAALGVAFLFFAIARRARAPHARAANAFALSRDAVRPSFYIIIASVAVSFGMFAWMTIGAQTAGAALGAVAILAIVAANTVFFGSLVVFLTEARRIPIELCALACAAVFSAWNDNHDVALVGDKPARPALTVVFSEWVRDAPRDASGKVPVVIATAEGGGIRAAYWTSSALHRLDDDAALQLSRRLFAISSVSGSSFGAAVYAGLKKDGHGAAGQGAAAARILQTPFLAPMVAKLVTGDFAQWFLPFPFRPFDRSRAMEDGFARAYERESPRRRNTMATPLAALREMPEAHVPLLFFNSTSVQSGRRVVTSAVEWLSPSPLPVDATDPIDFHDWLQADVTLATAAHNTARFPYISPAGRLRARHGEYLGHLVDGGYFDNTGAETANDVIDQLVGSGAASDARFIVLSLANTLRQAQVVVKNEVAWRPTRHLGEVFSPFRALLQARDARGTLALDRLRARVGSRNFVELRVCDDPDDDRTAREAPLGWQLSADMIAELDRQFSQKCFADAAARLAAALR